MWQVVVAIAITGLLLAIVGVTSDVLTYRELQRKLRQGEGKDLPLREPFKRLLYKFQTGKQARNNANSPSFTKKGKTQCSKYYILGSSLPISLLV